MPPEEQCYQCEAVFPYGTCDVFGPNGEPFCSTECRDAWEDEQDGEPDNDGNDNE